MTRSEFPVDGVELTQLLVVTDIDKSKGFYRHVLGAKLFRGLPNIRLYDLRHTCATLLLSRGEHPKIVGERLGHSSTTLTLDTYSHVLPDMQEQAAVRLEETLFS